MPQNQGPEETCRVIFSVMDGLLGPDQGPEPLYEVTFLLEKSAMQNNHSKDAKRLHRDEI